MACWPDGIIQTSNPSCSGSGMNQLRRTTTQLVRIKRKLRDAARSPLTAPAEPALRPVDAIEGHHADS